MARSHRRTHRHRRDSVRVGDLVSRLGESTAGFLSVGQVPCEPSTVDRSKTAVRPITVVVERELLQPDVVDPRVRDIAIVRGGEILDHASRGELMTGF